MMNFEHHTAYRRMIHIKDVYTNLHRIPNSKLVIKNQLSSEFQQITTSVLKGLKTKYIELNKQFTFQNKL